MMADNIGKRLKTIRKYLNLNQGEVCIQLQITKQTLSRYENGSRFPDSSFLQKFGKLYRVNGNWLLFGNGDMFLDNSIEMESREKGLSELQFYLNKVEELFKQLDKSN